MKGNSVERFGALVIAGDPAGELSSDPQITLSAQVPVHGKPMLDLVIDSLRSSKRIATITLLGSEPLDNLLSSRYIDRRISPVGAALSNIADVNNEVSGFIIVPCEAIHITGAVFDNLVDAFLKTENDIGIPCLSPESFGTQMPLPSAIVLDGKKIVPGVVSLVRKAAMIPAAIYKLHQINRDKGFLSNAGLFLPALGAIEESIIKKTKGKSGFFLFSDPSIALLVRLLPDLKYALEMIEKPWRSGFNKIKVIVNPFSGRSARLPVFFGRLAGIRKKTAEREQSAGHITDRIETYLNGFGLHPEIVVSKDSEEATQIASHCAKNGYDLVVAVGGDGTINAIVNGLAGSDTVLGSIPLGTVNLFALQLGIPMEIRAACQLIAEGNICKIDLGKANERYFTCLCGIGFDAFVIQKVHRGLKRALGAAAYVLIGIINYMRYSFFPVMLSVDEQPVIRKGYIVITGNGKYYSANMVISPDASIEDGYLDVVIFKKRNILSIVSYLRGFRRGNLTEYANVEYFQAKEIMIHRRGKHPYHVDGEPIGRTPVKITVAPGALYAVC